MDELEFADDGLPDDDVDVVVGMWRYWLLSRIDKRIYVPHT